MSQNQIWVRSSAAKHSTNPAARTAMNQGNPPPGSTSRNGIATRPAPAATTAITNAVGRRRPLGVLSTTPPAVRPGRNAHAVGFGWTTVA